MTAAVMPEDPGWPRLWADFGDNDGALIARLPAPWVTGEKATTNEWLSFGEAAPTAHYERLCAVCGERMDGTIVLGRSRETRKMTSGPGMHPRCAVLAVKFCPRADERLYGR